MDSKIQSTRSSYSELNPVARTFKHTPLTANNTDRVVTFHAFRLYSFFGVQEGDATKKLYERNC